MPTQPRSSRWYSSYAACARSSSIRSSPESQLISNAVSPQCQTPTSSRTSSGTSVVGLHGSPTSGSLSARASSIEVASATESCPTVALVKPTNAVPVARSHRSTAMNPGIVPVCPTSRPRAPGTVRKPSPYWLPGCRSTAASCSVGSASTSGWPCSTKSAYVARSVTVLHIWPAGAIAPVSECGSGVSVPSRWLTLYPCACGGVAW